VTCAAESIEVLGIAITQPAEIEAVYLAFKQTYAGMFQV
jgi:hypothetical protein